VIDEAAANKKCLGCTGNGKKNNDDPYEQMKEIVPSTYIDIHTVCTLTIRRALRASNEDRNSWKSTFLVTYRHIWWWAA